MWPRPKLVKILMETPWFWVALFHWYIKNMIDYPIGSMYAIYGNIYHQYTPNVCIYTIHGSYGYRFTHHISFNHTILRYPSETAAVPIHKIGSSCSLSQRVSDKLFFGQWLYTLIFVGCIGFLSLDTWYCWWKKSCTTLDGWNPINNGINHLSTGVGFLPSTVGLRGIEILGPRCPTVTDSPTFWWVKSWWFLWLPQTWRASCSNLGYIYIIIAYNSCIYIQYIYIYITCFMYSK